MVFRSPDCTARFFLTSASALLATTSTNWLGEALASTGSCARAAPEPATNKPMTPAVSSRARRREKNKDENFCIVVLVYCAAGAPALGAAPASVAGSSP